jgi:hypothetical protein
MRGLDQCIINATFLQCLHPLPDPTTFVLHIHTLPQILYVYAAAVEEAEPICMLVLYPELLIGSRANWSHTTMMDILLSITATPVINSWLNHQVLSRSNTLGNRGCEFLARRWLPYAH